jgi:hypothetical protein
MITGSLGDERWLDREGALIDKQARERGRPGSAGLIHFK